MEEYIYTVREVSKLLKTDIHTVYDLIKKGILKGLKLGKLKVTREELIRFLRENNGKDLTDLDNIKDLKE